MGEPYKQWIARIDRMAERAGLVEPGASYTQRHGRQAWLDMYREGLDAALAWEDHLAHGDDMEDDDGCG